MFTLLVWIDNVLLDGSISIFWFKELKDDIWKPYVPLVVGLVDDGFLILINLKIKFYELNSEAVKLFITFIEFYVKLIVKLNKFYVKYVTLLLN